jgi:thiol-disulfide isomerase/thioredoxin
MNTIRPAVLALISAASLLPAGDIVDDARAAAGAHNFALADREIQSYRAARGVTPEMVEALSWLGRGALQAGQYDRADRYALETRKLATGLLGHTGQHPSLDRDPHLPIALGAAIEVHAQALTARGERTAALAFLRAELTAYPGSSVIPRIQKNINLLTLEGKAAPALDVSHWLGPQPKPLAALKGHPVLLFFWAHWCSDCKAEVPVIARLLQTYGPQGLVLIGPTQHYGYAAEGDEATKEQETHYIDEVRAQYYAALSDMPVPVSEENFLRYGCSTTPTLVLLDRTGIVRMYHPGAMTYEALTAKMTSVFAHRAPGS